MLFVACAVTAGAACVGDPPVFAEPDGATPDAHGDEDATPGPGDGTARDAPDDDGPSDDGTLRSEGGRDTQGRDSGDGSAPCDPSTPFIAVEPIAELNAASDEEGARLTPDELVMYFTRRTGAGQPYQIFTSK